MTKKLYKNLSNKYSYKREGCSLCGQTTTKHVQGVPICNKCLKMKSIDSIFWWKIYNLNEIKSQR